MHKYIPIYEVGMNVIAGGKADFVRKKRPLLERGQGWLFWLCYSLLLIINFGFTFFIITLKVNICLKKLKTLQNFMLLCKYV